jgi:hypothetical protein
MLIKTVAALAIAAQAAKTMTERGVTEKVSAPRIQLAHNWLDSLKRTASSDMGK